MRRRLRALGVAAACACSAEPAASSVPAGPVDGTAARAEPAEAPRSSAPAPRPAPVRRAVALEPAGTTALSSDVETVVDPASAFEVELALPTADARLVLLDASDAHVPARVVREVGTVTRLALTPAAPLVPASRYVLRVEGWSERGLHDAEGLAWGPRPFALLVAGSPPPPEPKRSPRAKRR